MLDAADTKPEEFENGGFMLKTHQMFSVHTKPEEFKNAKTAGHFGCVFNEDSLQQITIIATPSFSKRFVFKMSSVHTKTKSWRVPPV